jgi:hypothetical protein
MKKLCLLAIASFFSALAFSQSLDKGADVKTQVPVPGNNIKTGKMVTPVASSTADPVQKNVTTTKYGKQISQGNGPVLMHSTLVSQVNKTPETSPSIKSTTVKEAAKY